MNVLRSCVIAVTGDFGKERSIDRIKLWIEFFGGVFSPRIDARVTHLVCSRADYKQRVTMVRRAQRARNIKIVTYDWLEESSCMRIKRNESPYLVEHVIQERAERKLKRKEDRKKLLAEEAKKFENDAKDFKRDMHVGGYHIFQEPDGFVYDIQVVRIVRATNQIERYNLKLYETDSVPRHYCCYWEFTSPTGPRVTGCEAPPVSSIEKASKAFEGFFEKVTQCKWADRANLGNEGEWMFRYILPAAGLSQGYYYDRAWARRLEQHRAQQ
ncbi:hypothetical protein MMC14_001445 [Varicellaria rhodocarpa]|nr:hypothetical protein [Varicellaria rhodocarpa]